MELRLTGNRATVAAASTGLSLATAVAFAAQGACVATCALDRNEVGGPARIRGGALARPEDFGALVTFLCSDYAGYITGAAIPIDGGLHPGLQ